MLVAESALNIGHEMILAGDSPRGAYSCVFEDDGDTGYFYALDVDRAEDERIIDALHIYNVADVVDAERPSRVQIVWSDDGLKAALLINEYVHAVFDFQQRRAYCRTGGPPPSD